MGATESDELAGLQRVDCCVFRRLLRATTNASPRSVAQAPALRIFAAEFVALEQPMVARLRGFWPVKVGTIDLEAMHRSDFDEFVECYKPGRGRRLLGDRRRAPGDGAR
jgi:hypothetical protein